MWEPMLTHAAAFVSGLWMGLIAPLLWEDWVNWRRPPQELKAQDPDGGADQQPEG